MKTRTKQKVEEEIVANKYKEMEISGDFFLEDFGKFKNLLRTSRKLSRNSESDKPSSDNRSSAEGEIKHGKQKKKCTLKDPTDKSKNKKNHPHSNNQIIEISSNESDSSEKKDVQGSDKQNDDAAENLWENTSSKFIPKKRRDIKLLSKIEESFKHFYNLIKDLHRSPPNLMLPHFSDDLIIKCKNEFNDESKEIVDRNSIESIEPHQELENIIDQDNPLEVPDEATNSNNLSKTSDSSHTTEQQSSLIAQEISIEYIHERIGSFNQNQHDSITLVPEYYQSQMKIASWSKCPLITNQSIHCQIAYFITDIVKRKYFNQQYRLFIERENQRNIQGTCSIQAQQSNQTNI